MAAGRRGPQALSLKLIDPPPSLTRTRREAAAAEHKHTPDELHGMVEDMITLLEGAVQPELRKGRYPDRKVARRVSEVVGPSPANSTPKSRTPFGHGHAGRHGYMSPAVASSTATPTTSPPASPPTAATAIPSSRAATG